MKVLRKLIFPAFLIVFHISFMNISVYCLPENSQQQCCCNHNSAKSKTSLAGIKISHQKPVCYMSEDKNSKDEILLSSYTQNQPVGLNQSIYLDVKTDLIAVSKNQLFVYHFLDDYYFSGRSPPSSF